MKKLILGLLVISATIIMYGVAGTQTSHAVSGADWKPGRIIDDVVFQNKSSMTVAQIQQFLDSKLPTCDRWGTTMIYDSAYGDTVSRALYSSRRGVATPFTCLKEYQENPTTKENNVGRPTYQVPGGKTAAQLIWDAAQAHNINPQVFMVLLQKEQSLITDDWPWPIQYEKATGSNCPDTAPCNPAYAGFWTQINSSGNLFNYYVNNFDEYNYAPGWNNILYHPNTACGTQRVFIENRFTAALYIYTPYVPNQAALNNLYGTGDGCSAYGNRNFWRMFNDWFGSSLWNDGSSEWDLVSISSPSTNTNFAQETTVTVTLRNTSMDTWYADGSTPPGKSPTRLATPSYNNTPHATASDDTWLGTRNQVRMQTPIVVPGSNAIFSFRVDSGYNEGQKLLKLIPIVEGRFLGNIGISYAFNVYRPEYELIEISSIPSSILPNEQKQITIKVRNVSGGTWYADGSVPVGKDVTRLATIGYRDSAFVNRRDSSWLGTRNQVRMQTPVVTPGQIAIFSFTLMGPIAKEPVAESLRLTLISGGNFLNERGININPNTAAADLSYQPVSGAIGPPLTMSPGQEASVSISMKNTGNVVWNDETVNNGRDSLRLMMNNPYYRSSPFFTGKTGNWLAASQISKTNGITMPGQTATFTFVFKAPAQPGHYKETFQPILGGRFLNDVGWAFQTTVN